VMSPVLDGKLIELRFESDPFKCLDERKLCSLTSE